MRSTGKKLSIMLICLVLALSFALTACDLTGKDESSKPGGDTSEISTGNDRWSYDPATNMYSVVMPEFEWANKTEFKVLVYDNTTQTTYYSEEVGYDKYETTDQVINDAVRERNNIIFERYGVEIVAAYTANVNETLNNDVLAGTGDYDAAMPFMAACASLAQANALYNLADARFEKYLDLSMPWWDQNATDSLSIDNKVFFTTGDISFMQKIVSVALTFNKQMMEDYYPDINLYDVVKNGNWTFDELVRLSKGVTADDGDGVFNYKDTWGLSSSYADATMYYLASGERLARKNANDIPELAVGGTRSITVAQKVLQELQVPNEWAIHAQEFGTSDIWVTSLDIFGENRALFRTSAFSAIKKLRQYTNADPFGVIPMPKFDTEQDSYYTPCSATMAYGVVIPASAPSPEFSAFMLEVMACEAKNYITKAYYDTVLKQRDMMDDESEAMLDDYIFNNVVYDLGLIYNFGGSANGVSSMFTTLMSTKSTDVTSTLESRRDAIITAIEEVVAKYQSH